MSSLFIGMPVYNGETFVGQALDCFIGQSFSDWKLLIADNCSQDRTFEICSEYAAKDSRITIIRHEQNIGAARNFKHVLDCADCKYFMWAACDDYWAPDFIEKCVNFLENSPETGMVFSNLFTFSYSGDKRLSKYFLKPLESKNSKKAFIKYLCDDASYGKANLIYSLYRLEIAKTAFGNCPLENCWGSDMVFTSEAVRIGGVKILEGSLFGKRQTSDEVTLNKEKLPVRRLTLFLDYVRFLAKLAFTNARFYYNPLVFYISLMSMLSKVLGKKIMLRSKDSQDRIAGFI